MSLRHLLADEIGLESAMLGGWRLQATHTPVYGRGGPSRLTPVAVIGGLVGRRHPQGAWQETTDLERSFGQGRAAAVALTLSLRNHSHVAAWAGAEAMRLFVDLPARLTGHPSIVRRALRHLPELDVPVRDIVAFVDVADRLAEPQRETLALLASAGIRIGLPASRPSQADHAIAADVLRIDPPWFRAAVRDETVRNLLALLISSCHARCGEVFAASLHTGAELDLAYAVGCDLFEGPVLAGRRLAGAEIDLAPRILESIEGGEALPGSGRTGA